MEITPNENAILEQMNPEVWYAPRQLKEAAGVSIKDLEYRGLLSRMCEKGLLMHGNGTNTHGFCLPQGVTIVINHVHTIQYPPFFFKRSM